MKKIISALVLGSILFTPVSALAATPTAAQIIRSEFKKQVTVNTAERVDLNLSVNYTKSYFDKKKPTDSGHISFQAIAENFPISETLSNAELKYRVPKIVVKNGGQTMIEATDGLDLDVRVFAEEKIVYFRLNKLHPEAVAGLASLGFVAEPIMGQWVKFSLTELLQSVGLGESEFNALFSPALSEASNDQEIRKLQAWYVVNELKLGSPLSIVSSGRITKNAEGQRVQTVRVKINPRWYPAMEKLMIDQYKAENPEATAVEIKAVQDNAKKMFTDIKKFLTKVTIDVQVNLTTAAVTGTTVKFRQVETAYDYVESKNSRGNYVTKKVAEGRETIDAAASMNWRPGSGLPLEVPASAINYDVAWDMVYQKPVQESPGIYESLEDSEFSTDDFKL